MNRGDKCNLELCCGVTCRWTTVASGEIFPTWITDTCLGSLSVCLSQNVKLPQPTLAMTSHADSNLGAVHRTDSSTNYTWTHTLWIKRRGMQQHSLSLGREEGKKLPIYSPNHTHLVRYSCSPQGDEKTSNNNKVCDVKKGCMFIILCV